MCRIQFCIDPENFNLLGQSPKLKTAIMYMEKRKLYVTLLYFESPKKNLVRLFPAYVRTFLAKPVS